MSWKSKSSDFQLGRYIGEAFNLLGQPICRPSSMEKIEMGQRESRLSRKIMKKLREKGVFVFKVHGSEFMMSGLPDLICCVDGYFVGLEVKHPETEDDLSERQKYVQKQIRRANGISETVTTPERALEVIDRIRANQRHL